MKLLQLSLISLSLLASCISAGIPESFDKRTFPTSKRQIELGLNRLYTENLQYKMPDELKEYDTWTKSGYDFLKGRLIYFKDKPREMYYISFIGDSVTLTNPNAVSIAIRAVTQFHVTWLYKKDFDNKEQERIESRFDKEIISKLEKYTHTKAKRED